MDRSLSIVKVNAVDFLSLLTIKKDLAFFFCKVSLAYARNR
uniref:Uncharacterized protein n=1 Tax=Klebsiella pneumoniae TaxID=573 RepID=A0A6G6ANT0_KLEPN|nr:hypothetical protein [Klebsiella pneumoniae]UFD96585.1 hypothetical protein [Klebsiella oxytoca]UFD97083.1 hypothetical protein [Klebsiella pneumoniae]